MLTKWSVNAQPCAHFSQCLTRNTPGNLFLAHAWNSQRSVSPWAAGSVSKVAIIAQIFLLVKYKTFG